MSEENILNEEQVDKASDQVNYLNPNYPGSRDVADTDQNLTMDDLFQQVNLPSLPRQIFSRVDITGATGGVFAVRQKEGTNDIELVRRNFNLYASKPIKSGITQEAEQDIEAMYGAGGKTLVCNMLRSLANDAENKDCIDFLKENSMDAGIISYESKVNAEKIYFVLAQKVHELILQANHKTIRSFSAWTVMPYKQMAAVLSQIEYMGGVNTAEHNNLYVGKIGLTKFYMNPDPQDTNIYVGIKNDKQPGRSSAYFGNFKSDIIKLILQDSGQQEFMIYNRYGFATSPLHNEQNPMLFKFTVDL